MGCCSDCVQCGQQKTGLVFCLDDLTNGLGQTDSTVKEYHCKRPPLGLFITRKWGEGGVEFGR